VFTLTTGRQPAPLSTTQWAWVGDNQPSVPLLSGAEVTIPAKSLRAGQFYTLRATPDSSQMWYDEITFYVDTPPTRGRCFAAMSAESTVTVTCSEFAVVGGSDLSNPTAGQLTYQYGYYDVANDAWAWFETSTDSVSTYCIPAGTVDVWVKVSNFKGSATYSKAVFSATPTYYASVAKLTDASAAYGGVNGNTILGKYQAWSQLARLDKLSQCTSVWASNDWSADLTSLQWSSDVSNLVSYLQGAARGDMSNYDPTQGVSTLNAASLLSVQQTALLQAYSNVQAGSATVNPNTAAGLCTVSLTASLAAKTIKVGSDLATVRAVSLAPYQLYPLSVADYPTASNLTAATQIIGAVAKSSHLVQTSTTTNGVSVASTTCGKQAATALAMTGDLVSAALAQKSITAAALPKRVANGNNFDLDNTLIATTGQAFYDGFVLNSYYDLNKDFSSLEYTTASKRTSADHPPGIATTGILPYGKATSDNPAVPVYVAPVYDSWAVDALFLGDARAGAFGDATYTSTTFRATSLTGSDKLYTSAAGTVMYGPNQPDLLGRNGAGSPSIRAGDADLYVNYRAMALPTNWAYNVAGNNILSNAVYGYTVYPSLPYLTYSTGLTNEANDVFFSQTSRGEGLLQTDTSIFGPIEIVIPVDVTKGTLGAIAQNKVACASQDFNTGDWSITETWTCKEETPVNNLDAWTPSASVGSGCRVGVVTATTVTCICWGKPRVNVLVQEYDHAARCPDCENVAGGGKTIDNCGVCGGDDSSCRDCKGNINGTESIDACGVCGGDGTICVGCDGKPNSTARPDACGVCNGDNSTCLGCVSSPGEVPLPIPAGGKVFDGCGICGGNNATCMGCDNVPYSTKKFDKCGICGGNSNISYPQFGYTCVGRFITPDEGSRVTIASGNSSSFIIKAKASDNNNALVVRSFNGADGFVAPKFSFVQVGENITGTWTWTPKHVPGASNDYTLEISLVDRTGAVLGTRQFLFSVVFCQYVAASGDTLSTIAEGLFGDASRWRTLWWLNPDVTHKDEELAAGMRVEIGRRFKVASNDTLEYYVGVFGGTYSRVMNENPLKLKYLQGGKNFIQDTDTIKSEGLGKSPVIDISYEDYYRRVSYDGTEFCIVSEMDSYTRYSVAKLKAS